MARKKRKNVAPRKLMKFEECYDDNHSAQQSSDDNGGNENSAKNRANIDSQCYEENFARDSFYEKLIKLNESSGLSLVFNFRETKLDLYLVYKDVTERGGFHEVSKAGKWNEVASAASIKNYGSILPSQIQKVYENLLGQYEQIHHYRTPAAVSGYGVDCSVRKRKSCDSSSEDDRAEKGMCSVHNCQVRRGPGRPRKQPTLTIIRDPFAPQKPRTSYQLFLKMECERLRKLHGESSGNQNLRNLAIEAWRHLSKYDRLPYVEASRKDKERFDREMAVYKQNKNKKVTLAGDLLDVSTSNLINFGASSPINDDYYVTLEVDAGNLPVPDESVVESTIEMLKNAKPNDAIFQMNWDGCSDSPDTSQLNGSHNSKHQLLGSSDVEG